MLFYCTRAPWALPGGQFCLRPGTQLGEQLRPVLCCATALGGVHLSSALLQLPSAGQCFE